MTPLARIATLLAAAILTGGCVSFEVAPMETMGCDASLAGTWQGQSGDGEPQTLQLDAQCSLIGTDDDGTVETHTIHTADLDDQHYIVVDETEARTVVDTEGKTLDVWPASRVSLFRYRREGDRLLVWVADPGIAESLGGHGVTVRSDATLDAKTHKPVASMVRSSVLLGGKREALAAMLRARGDRLFLGMSPDKAFVLQRIPDKASSP